jgi:hypothetical protein
MPSSQGHAAEGDLNIPFGAGGKVTACPSPRVILLILAVLLAFLSYTASSSAQAGVFTPTGNMTVPRAGHSAMLLMNGKVLITGGGRETSAHAELFDPVAGTFSAAGEMITPRYGYTQTLLADGRVLITGGFPTGGDGNSALASAELFDPSTGIFSAREMTTPRVGHTATLLTDGRVLIAGGFSDNFKSALASAELYDPCTGTFTATGTIVVRQNVLASQPLDSSYR